MGENRPLLEEILSSSGLEAPPEQVQDAVKVTEYWQGECQGSSREERLIAVCWALVSIYQTLLFTRQQSNRDHGQTAAAPREQPVLGAVAPIQKKKSKTKSVCTGRDKEEAGPSQQEEEAGLEIITQSLSPGER